MYGNNSVIAITNVTVVDGFIIRGGGEASSAIFNLYDSSPTIKNNIIDGGECTGLSVCVYNDGSSPSISGN